MKQKRAAGYNLIIIIFLLAVLLAIVISLSRIVLNSMRFAENQVIGLEALYLAEAGIEKAKYNLKKNPGWYTDLPHAPIDDVDWIIGPSNGKAVSSPDGEIKMIREKDKLRAYSIGRANNATRIIKIEFELSPFKLTAWQML